MIKPRLNKKSRVLFGALVCLLIFIPTAWANSGSDSKSGGRACGRWLESKKQKDLKFKVDLAQLWMAHRFSQYPSIFSMRFKRAMVRTASTETGDVVSYGSGPDVFSPLINFPMANRIHLVDSFSHWGKGTADVLKEIALRLKAIHPEIQVTLKQIGFLAGLPQSISTDFKIQWNGGSHTDPVDVHELSKMAEWTINQGMEENTPFQGWKEPVVLGLRWEQEGLGWVEREIFLHYARDYHQRSHLESLNKSLGDRQISGIIVEGAPFPAGLSSDFERLSAKGVGVLEVFSDNIFQKQWMRDLKAQEKFVVRLVHMETYQRYGSSKPIELKLYTVRRKR